jgi:hypothetical protein
VFDEEVGAHRLGESVSLGDGSWDGSLAIQEPLAEALLLVPLSNQS